MYISASFNGSVSCTVSHCCSVATRSAHAACSPSLWVLKLRCVPLHALSCWTVADWHTALHTMAFFGLTQLGPQDPFAAANPDALDIGIFSEEEFRRAFNKLDKDGSHTITIDELAPLLEIVYHGPAPEAELKKLMARFDTNADGRITWAEFRRTLADAKAAAAATKDEYADKAGTEFKSSSELRETMRRHKRVEREPQAKSRVPLTAGQEYGWDKEVVVKTVRFPKKSCAETAYIDAMVKSGVYYA